LDDHQQPNDQHDRSIFKCAAMTKIKRLPEKSRAHAVCSRGDDRDRSLT